MASTASSVTLPEPGRCPDLPGLADCLTKALEALQARQHPDGYWEGHLASSPLATACALAALASNPQARFDRHAAGEYLARSQNPDGGWGDALPGKSNLAATLLVSAAQALCAAGTEGNRPKRFLAAGQEDRAQAWIAAHGGLAEGLRRVYGSDLTFQVPIRMTAACANLLEWRQVEALPFELACLPRPWLGGVGLPVVSYALPALVCIGLARHVRAPSRIWPLRRLRTALTGPALRLAGELQPQSGGFLEAIPITAFCLLGLEAAGLPDHPVARGARDFLCQTQRPDGSWPVEVNLSVWNTTRTLEALAAGGLLEQALPAPARHKLLRWLLDRQQREPHPYTATAPGGWGWNHLSGSVPDADDTAGALLALRTLGLKDEDPALRQGLRWLQELQNRDGGWPTFCRGWQRLPFDKSAPDLTAHALRALLAGPGPLPPATRARMERAWRYLERAQRPDGSFKPLWFGCESAPDNANALYGTAHVLLACQAAGGPEGASGEQDRLGGPALAWLRAAQNPDGGFGGVPGAPSSAEETGLALRVLAGQERDRLGPACYRAARWLVEHQRPDGSWDPTPIGFYFAVLWYHEAQYPLAYALGGLGRFARGAAAGEG